MSTISMYVEVTEDNMSFYWTWEETQCKVFITMFTRAQVQCPMYYFVRSLILQWGVVRPSTNPQDRKLPLVSCFQLLIPCIHSYLHYLEMASTAESSGINFVCELQCKLCQCKPNMLTILVATGAVNVINL